MERKDSLQILFVCLLLALILIFYDIIKKQLILRIGIPAFFLALEPNHRRVEGHFLGNVVKISLPSAMAVIVCIAYIYTCANHMHYSEDVVTLLSVIVICMNGYMVLLKVSAPYTPLRIALLVVIFFALCIGIYVGGPYLSFASFSLASTWKHMIVFLGILVGVSKVGKILVNKLYPHT